MRNVFSTMNTAHMLARKARLSRVTRLMYAASSAPMPYSPHSRPDSSPIAPSIARLPPVPALRGRMSRSSISPPISTITAPKASLMSRESVFLSSSMPGMQPMSITSATGAHMRHCMWRRSRQASIMLLG